MGREIELSWDWRDVPRAARLAFSDRKIALHARALGLTYVLVLLAFYVARATSGIGLGEVWRQFGLNVPAMVLARDASTFETVAATAALLVGWVAWVYWGTAVAKMTLEELRGDPFYPREEALQVARRCHRGVVGTLLAVCLFALVIRALPYVGGLIGRIPSLGEWWIAVGSLLLFPAFFAGLLLALLSMIGVAGILLLPAIAGSTGSRATEISYQLTVIVWSSGWRLLVYEFVMLVTAAVAGGTFLLVGWAGLHAVLSGVVRGYPDFARVLAAAWSMVCGGAWPVPWPWGSAPAATIGLSPALTLASVITALGIVAVTITVAAYVLTIGTVANVVIYVNLRHRIWGDNVLLSRGTEQRQAAADGGGRGDSASNEVNVPGSQRVTDDA